MADATDLTPFADYVVANDALLSPLRDCASPSTTISGYHSAETSNQTEMSEGKAFAVRHFKSQLDKAALQQRRTQLQWQADVYSVFTGFDRGGGFVTGSDFKNALNILGVSISNDLLSGLVSQGSVALKAADLINYEEVLCTVFEDLSVSDRVIGSSSKVLDDLDTDDRGKRFHRSAWESSSHPSAIALSGRRRPAQRTKSGYGNGQENQRPVSGAVKALISVVRRGMEKFIVKGNDIEDVCLMSSVALIDFD